MNSTEAILKQIDELEAGVTNVIHQHRKLKRDRDALLAACKAALALDDSGEGEYWSNYHRLLPQLRAAIAQAESEK